MIGGIIEQRGSRTSKGGRRMAKPSSWSASIWQAIPFWAACFVLVSWYPMFYPPAWDQKLYWDTLDFTEAEYQGKKVKLNDPIRGGSKKFYVYVKDGDKVKKVSFGDTTGLSIKRDDPARRKSFRARHNCDNPGPKTKARYWSCYQWRANAPVDN